MGIFDRMVAWLAGDRVPPQVALVERNFMRTCAFISIILQQALADADEVDWVHSRVWLASATHAYFTYALWNGRFNGDDAAFARALDQQLVRLADDIAKREGTDREQVAEAVRQSVPILKRAFDAIGSGGVEPAADFPFTLLHHLLKIVIGERAGSSRAFDPDIAMRLVGIMSEAVAALRPFNRR